MKHVFAVALTCAVLASANAFAEDKAAPAEMDAKQAEMMKAWKEASTPGPEHAQLKSLAGKWKVTTQSWQSEGGKPEVTTGTSTFKPVMGGRYVQQEFKGKMMGMPYEGIGMMGYNNTTQKFESTWHDSMSTASMFMEGSSDPATKTIAQTGEYMCPVKKELMKMRSEFKIVDKNKATFTMYMPDMVTGKEYKGMEQTYTRIN